MAASEVNLLVGSIIKSLESLKKIQKFKTGKKYDTFKLS